MLSPEKNVPHVGKWNCFTHKWLIWEQRDEKWMLCNWPIIIIGWYHRSIPTLNPEGQSRDALNAFFFSQCLVWSVHGWRSQPASFRLDNLTATHHASLWNSGLLEAPMGQKSDKCRGPRRSRGTRGTWWSWKRHSDWSLIASNECVCVHVNVSFVFFFTALWDNLRLHILYFDFTIFLNPHPPKKA